MKKIMFLLSLAMVLSITAAAQKKVSPDDSTRPDGSTSARPSRSSKPTNSGINAGTQATGQLTSSLDVDRAQVGDQVILKTTSAIKENGRVVIAKGSQLIGRVSEVSKKAKGNATSRLGLVFEQLQQGGSQIPISAMITSVFSSRASTPVADSDIDAFGSASAQPNSRSNSSSGGGLLGGVGSTVGGIANSTGQTVGNTVGGVVNSTGSAVGSTTGMVTTGIKGLSVSNSTGSSAQGGSLLTQSGSNLHLDKGTMFNLSLSGSSSTSISKQQ